MQEYKLKVEKYFRRTKVYFRSAKVYLRSFEVQNNIFEVQNYTFEVHNYILRRQKYTFEIQKYKVQKPTYHLSAYRFVFAFSLDMFSFCTGPQSWRNFPFLSSQPFAWPCETYLISKHFAHLCLYKFLTGSITRKFAPAFFPQLSSRSAQLLLVHRCFAMPVGISNFTLFFTQRTTPLLRNCNFASLLKGLQCLIKTFLASLLSQVLQIRMPLSILNEQIGFQIKIVLANLRIALTSALSFKLVYRWVLEKESDDFLTGIVLTVWGLCWYNLRKTRIYTSRWWFQTSFFIHTWGNDPISLIFFRWVETINQIFVKVIRGTGGFFLFLGDCGYLFPSRRLWCGNGNGPVLTICRFVWSPAIPMFLGGDGRSLISWSVALGWGGHPSISMKNVGRKLFLDNLAMFLFETSLDEPDLGESPLEKL